MNKRELEGQLRDALAQPGQALDAVVDLLVRLRPMHPSGAGLVLKEEADLGTLLAGGPEAAPELAALLIEIIQADRCLGCGTCCITSSPTLYAEDLERIGPESLPRQALYTLRPGERVSSAREGGARLLDRELIKLREGRPEGSATGAGCVFLEKGRCGMYEHRPMQCRVLECWSGRHAGQLAGHPRLTRAMLFADDETALALIEEYDLKLPAGELTRALESAARRDADASDQALVMLEMDHNLRQGVSQRYGYSAQDLDLMWGRPALLVARSHGLEPAFDAEGKLTLKLTKSANDL
jgi:Fe-S-cluster containining protein